MRSSIENDLDQMIDALNKEEEPKPAVDQERAELWQLARAIKSSKPAADPDQELGERVYDAVKSGLRRRWLVPAAAAAGFLLFFFLLTAWSSLFHRDLVYAMDQAVSQLSSYHAVIVFKTKNAAGKEWMSRRVEVWSAGDRYLLRQQDGTVTANNGTRRWQVQPRDRLVIDLPVAPDPTREKIDLKEEAKRAGAYPHTVVGEERIAGRLTSKIRVSPPGGLDYYLWIDNKTKLPLQLQTPLKNSLQTILTYQIFDPNIRIDPELFAYRPPQGYRVMDNNPEQQVATIGEAAAISRLTPLLPKEAPGRIFTDENHIVLDYGDTTVSETAARGRFEPAPGSALGKAAGGPLEVLTDRLRWRQNGIEIVVEGPRRMELARQIAAELTLPDASGNPTSKAKVQVPVDLNIARADQQQVDGGHSPWQLDPLQVSLTFVNLKVTPGGIVGEPKIPERSFQLVENNGVEAVVSVTEGPVKRVYLKRLVRQDETGIWSIVGYDPA